MTNLTKGRGMNQSTKKLLAGMCIGDGYCRYNTLYVIHGPDQKEYVQHKKKLLENAGLKVTDIERSVKTKKSNYKQVGFSVSHQYIGWIRKRLYKDGKKILTKKFFSKVSFHGLALWYMDDGSLYSKKKNGVEHTREVMISTYCSEKEVEELIEFFKGHGIYFTKKRNKGLFSLRCGKRNAQLFLNLIKNFSCKSMEYKFAI